MDKKTNITNEPWKDPHSIWKTRAAFFSWIRGQLRRSWMHYPISKGFKSSMCRPNTAGGRAKTVGDCAVCRETFAKSHLQVDHVIPAGGLSSWETLAEFTERLFTTSEHMRLVCKPCHVTITTQERFGLNRKDALVRQQVVIFCRMPPKLQTLKLTLEGILPARNNAATRRAAYEKHLSFK